MDRKLLAQTYQTPLYVYDFDEFTKNYNNLKTAFSGKKSLLAYAVKANSNLSVIKHFADLGAGADCVSLGEIKRALKAGVNPYKIIFSGVGKQEFELKEALENGILFINIESSAEFFALEKIAKTMQKCANISLRVNPNIDAKTHPYISTGLEENKFGIDINTAKELYIKAKNSPHLNPVGIHFHIGSQLLDLSPIKEASMLVADLARSLLALDINLKFFDVGGGLGVRYDQEQTIDPTEYARAITSSLKDLDLTIICEPGRFLVANGAEFITQMLYEKKTAKKTFYIVDGAMNDLLRPSLYNAYHKAEAITSKEALVTADIVGPVCESGDFLAKNAQIAKCQAGDLISIKSVGAYGFSMSSNYNTRPRCAEVAVQNGTHRLIRRREKIEELYEKEEEFL